MNWGRTPRKQKIVILGSRAGTSLVQKCLLLTGMLNWGLWSLESYECEPHIKPQIWATYPNVPEKVLKSKHFWELAKAPVLSLVLEDLVKIYGNIKFIVMERPLLEKIDSHLKTWGDGFYVNFFKKVPAFQNWIKRECGFIPDDHISFIGIFLGLRQQKRENFLKDYPQEKILRIQFHDLMNNFEKEMKKIADFVGVNFNLYKGLWNEMRKIKHMDTASNVEDYIK